MRPQYHNPMKVEDCVRHNLAIRRMLETTPFEVTPNWAFCPDTPQYSIKGWDRE